MWSKVMVALQKSRIVLFFFFPVLSETARGHQLLLYAIFCMCNWGYEPNNTKVVLLRAKGASL